MQQLVSCEKWKAADMKNIFNQTYEVRLLLYLRVKKVVQTFCIHPNTNT